MRQGSKLRWAGVLGGGVALLLAAGCAAPVRTALPGAARDESSVLFKVRFHASDPRERGPTGLVVGVDDEAGFENLQFAFGPSARTAGGDSEFLVRLDLRAGPYRLRRISGVDGSGVISPRYDASIDLDIDARAHTADYLGRFEVESSSGQPRPASLKRAVIGSAGPRISSVVGHDGEDLPEFMRTWPALRQRTASEASPSERKAPAQGPAARSLGSCEP